MKISDRKFKKDLYQILNKVAETGEPVEVVRKGRTLQLMLKPAESLFDRRLPHPDVLTDPSDELQGSWSMEWKPYAR